MTREIKFRGWFDDIGMIPTITDIKTACVLMQYTGLKDKNGKKIYELDIVKIERRDYSCLCGGKINICIDDFGTRDKEGKLIRVKEYNPTDQCTCKARIYYDYEEVKWWAGEGDRGATSGFSFDCEVEDMEVVGNIYENRNLLNKQ